MTVQVVPDPEPAMLALLALLETCPGVQTVTRIWQPWEQLNELVQPAIIITEPKEKRTQRRGQAPLVVLDVKLVVYLRVDNKDTVTPPITKLNNLVKEIATALLPSGSGIALNTQTLGGTAQSCVVEGDIIKDAGILDEQASALVPVTITLS